MRDLVDEGADETEGERERESERERQGEKQRVHAWLSDTLRLECTRLRTGDAESAG